MQWNNMSYSSIRLRSPRVTLGYIVALVGLSGAIASACSASGEDDGGDGTGNSGNGASGNSGNGGDGVGGGLLGGAGNEGVGGGCADISVTAQELPLDMYIMLDKSGSMQDGNKWGSVTSALNTFVGLPEADGLGVGLQFFPVDSGVNCQMFQQCTVDADCGDPQCGPCFGGQFCIGSSDSCDSNDYATPNQPIAVLPGAAGAITAAINSQSPDGDSTPTGVALQGAVDYSTAWAIANPDHVVINVLATDGDPTGCEPTDLATINGIAAAGANGSPQILTFVIGVGSSLSALNGIAAAGGTQQAFLVDTNANVSQQFLDALVQIQGAALGCTYQVPIPEEGTPDFDTVQVVYTPGDGGAEEVLTHVSGQADCVNAGGPAWYYDNNTTPTKVIMCDDTCSIISADDMGTVDIVIDCETLIK